MQGIWGQKTPSGVQGQSPGRGSGGRSPPEAEAILDFYMHNFDLSKGKIQRTCQNLVGHYTLASPTPNSGGRVPRPTKVYASGTLRMPTSDLFASSSPSCMYVF